MMYKQVITDNFEVYDVELDLIVDKMQILDMDTTEIETENLDSYNLEDDFEDMFSPDLFREGSNHVITVQLFDMDEDECTGDPVYKQSFRCPYQG